MKRHNQLKIIYMSAMTSLCGMRRRFTKRTVTLWTTRVLPGKFVRNTVETSRVSSYRWLSMQTKVSSGFCDIAVNEEDNSRTLVNTRVHSGITHRGWGSDTCRWSMGGHAFILLAGRQFTSIATDEKRKKRPLLAQVMRFTDSNWCATYMSTCASRPSWMQNRCINHRDMHCSTD